MNDCENEVYTRVATVLREKFPSINLAGEYVKAPSAFPHVSIVQSDTVTVYMKTTDTRHYDRLLFEINIYSNKATGKKSECKAIAQEIDRIMFSMNFRRMSMTPVPNMENESIYRIVARYRVTTDGKFFYRR